LFDKTWHWLSDPVLGKLVAFLVGVLLGIAVVRSIQHAATRFIQDKNVRYRARKAIGYLGYFIALLVLAAVFSDRLGRLTVVFGVAGAGVAFALQEVIASIAGWVAISLGGFYKIGDRVQLGGIKGDVIDVGLLRTTLMEVGRRDSHRRVRVGYLLQSALGNSNRAGLKRKLIRNDHAII
jgi:small-conductance mechanosensitive channel